MIGFVGWREVITQELICDWFLGWREVITQELSFDWFWGGEMLLHRTDCDCFGVERVYYQDWVVIGCRVERGYYTGNELWLVWGGERLLHRTELWLGFGVERGYYTGLSCDWFGWREVITQDWVVIGFWGWREVITQDWSVIGFRVERGYYTGLSCDWV